MRAASAPRSLPSSSLLFSALLVSVFASAAFGQTGNVLSFVKQSDTQGTFTPPLVNLDELGGTMIGLGDLDGPGPSKFAVAVGSAFHDDLGTDEGAVYINFLDTAGNILSTTKISNVTGVDPVDEFGSSLAFLGDLDGAGPSVAAMAVGTPGDDDGGGSRGAVYILFLSSSGTVLSQQKISNLAGGFTATLDNNDEFGGTLAWLGDLDDWRPSAATLAVGAAGDDDGGSDKGAVHLLFLNRNGTVFANRKISNTAGGFTGTLDAFDGFGSSVASLQDLDGIGPSKRALAVGAAADDDGGTDCGAVWVCFLSDTGLVLSHSKISATAGNLGVTLVTTDEFGGALEHVGDMDAAGAGVTTLAVGAAGNDDGGTDRGAVYLVHLTSAGVVSSRSKISGTSGNFAGPLANLDAFGSSLAYLGDLDGGGASGVALCVGAVGDDSGGADRGAFYILFLQGTPTTDAPRDPNTPDLFALGAASPNPFRVSTAIPVRSGGASRVQLEIRDVAGRLVRRYDAAGSERVIWDGRDEAGHAVAAGTYFMRLARDGRAMSATGKTVLLR